MKLDIAGLGFVTSTAADQQRGLLGWVTCIVNDALLIDGIAIRRTRDGQLALSFPSRTARDGRKHSIVRPLDDAARQRFEQEIFKALRNDLEESLA